MENMKRGVLSEKCADRLFGDKEQAGVRVRYELHPKSTDMALKVYREDDGMFLGGYVSVGDDGIIER